MHLTWCTLRIECLCVKFWGFVRLCAHGASVRSCVCIKRCWVSSVSAVFIWETYCSEWLDRSPTVKLQGFIMYYLEVNDDSEIIQLNTMTVLPFQCSEKSNLGISLTLPQFISFHLLGPCLSFFCGIQSCFRPIDFSSKYLLLCLVEKKVIQVWSEKTEKTFVNLTVHPKIFEKYSNSHLSRILNLSHWELSVCRSSSLSCTTFIETVGVLSACSSFSSTFHCKMPGLGLIFLGSFVVVCNRDSVWDVLGFSNWYILPFSLQWGFL